MHVFPRSASEAAITHSFPRSVRTAPKLNRASAGADPAMLLLMRNLKQQLHHRTDFFLCARATIGWGLRNVCACGFTLFF